MLSSSVTTKGQVTIPIELRVICWVLVISLPLTVPMMLINWPPLPVRPSAWLGFGYVTLFSMWIGFFAWYRGLALGGNAENVRWKASFCES